MYRFATPGALTRDAGLLLTIASIGGCFGVVFFSILQLYLKSIGFDSRVIGLLSMVSIVSMASFSIPIGILGDRLGRRNMMILGCLLFLPSLYILLLTKSLPLLMLSFALRGLGNASFSVIMFPLYSSYFKEEEMDAAFGLMSFLNMASGSVGSLLGLAPPSMVRALDMSLSKAYWSLLAVSSVALSSILPLLLLIHPDKPGGEGFRFRLVSRDALLRFSLLRSIIGFGAGLFINLIPYYLSVKFGVESGVIGVALSATFILSAVANLYAARVSRVLGVFRGTLYTLSGVIPLYLGVVISPVYPLAAALYVARTGLMSIYTTLLISMMMRMVREEERATVNSVVSLAESLSRGIGSAMGGAIMSRMLDLPGFISVSVYASATILFYLTFKEMERSLGEA